MRKNSVKSRRVNDEVRRTLADIISHDMKDPRISSLTSVMEADVATDLKTCKVYISVYGSKKDAENTMKGLRNASGFIRSELARKINLRNTPALTFILDDSIAYGVEMGKKIDEVTAADRAADEQREIQASDHANDTVAEAFSEKTGEDQ